MLVGWKHQQLKHTLTEHLKSNPPILKNNKEMLGPTLIQNMRIYEAPIIHIFRKTVILYNVTFQANSFLESLLTKLTLVCFPSERVGVKLNSLWPLQRTASFHYILPLTNWHNTPLPSYKKKCIYLSPNLPPYTSIYQQN